MAQEVETKVLDIDLEGVLQTLELLGAEKTMDTILSVDWYRTKGTEEGREPWFLRIRSDTSGRHEVTWKARSDILGTSRKHKEINFTITEPEKLADLLTELGLERYAHQEKRRKSFAYEDWRFDIDEYPAIPAFLEIEGRSEEHVNSGIKMLKLEGNRTWAKGERILIQEVYGKDWYLMKF